MARAEQTETDPQEGIFSYREVDEMLRPGGIESWLRLGRIPYVNKASNGDGTFYWFHLPPENATSENRMVLEEGGVVCYLDKNDKEGQGCKIVIATLIQGKALVDRMNSEGRKIQIEKMPPIQRYSVIFANAVLSHFRN